MSKFTILVDAVCLTKPISGIPRVSNDLINGLSKNGHNLILYAHEKLSHFSQNKNIITNQSLLHRWDRHVGLLKHNNVPKDSISWNPSHRAPFLSGNFPLVVTIHDLVWRRFPETMQKRTLIGEKIFFENALKKADVLACVSEFTKNELEYFYPQYSYKAIVTPNPVQKLRMQKSIKNNLGIKGKFFLFVGTFEPRKNIERLLIAWAKLPMKLRDSHQLVFCGKLGWQQNDIISLADLLGISRRVIVVESPADSVVAKLYHDCEALLMPSLYEGFGMPVFEALHFNKPSVVSRNTPMSHFADECCLSVNPYSTSEISSRILHLMTDPVTKEKLLIHKNRLLKQLSIDNALAAYEKTFNSAVESFLAK